MRRYVVSRVRLRISFFVFFWHHIDTIFEGVVRVLALVMDTNTYNDVTVSAFSDEALCIFEDVWQFLITFTRAIFINTIESRPQMYKNKAFIIL